MMAGVLSMGAALEKTGGAEMIAHSIQSSLGQYNAYVTLSAIFLVSFLSTNFISSKATAALMAPVVINLSSAMGVVYKPFLVSVMFGCSLTFMTPINHTTITFVYDPRNYKFQDYLKFGTSLYIIILISAFFVILYFFLF